MSWNDIPTCKESGVPTDYVMLRGIFMPGGVPQEAVDYYVELFKKVRETPEWKEFMERRRVQPDLHEPARSTPTGSRRPSRHARRADEGSRLPRQEVT